MMGSNSFGSYVLHRATETGPAGAAARVSEVPARYAPDRIAEVRPNNSLRVRLESIAFTIPPVPEPRSAKLRANALLPRPPATLILPSGLPAGRASTS